MKIRCYPADEYACGHYRVVWPAAALAAQGHDVEIAYPGDEIRGLLAQVDKSTGRIVQVDHPGCDILVLQRVLNRQLFEAIPLLQAQGVAVVVEIDDNYNRLPLHNVARDGADPANDPDDNWLWLAEACKIADLVVCTTPALAKEYGAHGRVRVVPNYIPESFLTVEREVQDQPTVGWAGNLEIHRTDLQVMGNGIRRALAATGGRFRLVGDRSQVAEVGRTLSISRIYVTGWQEMDTYPRHLARLDVGLVPLELSMFNESKSWLKGLEYAAVGTPFIATGTGPYRQLHELGFGELTPNNAGAWYGRVRRLLEDQPLREDLGAQYRQLAAGMTIEGNAWRFLEAWSEAMNTRSSGVSACRSSDLVAS